MTRGYLLFLLGIIIPQINAVESYPNEQEIKVQFKFIKENHLDFLRNSGVSSENDLNLEEKKIITDLFKEENPATVLPKMMLL